MKVVNENTHLPSSVKLHFPVWGEFLGTVSKMIQKTHQISVVLVPMQKQLMSNSQFVLSKKSLQLHCYYLHLEKGMVFHFNKLMKERVSKLTYPTLQHCLRWLYTMNGNSKHKGQAIGQKRGYKLLLKRIKSAFPV